MADQQQRIFDRERVLFADEGSRSVNNMIGLDAHVLCGIDCQNRAHLSFNDLTKRQMTDGNLGHSTPLLDACIKGDFEGVKRMIEVWRLDVEAAATIFINFSPASLIEFNADRLQGVTPLFVAALKNDVELVRYLVGKGANVSSRTSTDNRRTFCGITPLHAALLPVTYIASMITIFVVRNTWSSQTLVSSLFC